MSVSFVLTLTGIAAALLVLRLVVPGLPAARVARRLTSLDLGLTVVGVLGLILHCASMFFRPLVAAIPGSASVISQINSMGTASMIWYTVPAVLILVGLRRQHWIALIFLAGSPKDDTASEAAHHSGHDPNGHGGGRSVSGS
ncbi:hypothetical protein [Arthrobacter sp. H41]|uniref:hypothetical protein n=1 Tax=Arthrobacter sp. H41 TaxID=1312978 RepID=UPI00047A0436|nr:hypothetical protein [Arthrobacter sp. H41]